MKIDITIRDLTPEEANRITAYLHSSKFAFKEEPVKDAPKKGSPKAGKAVPRAPVQKAPHTRVKENKFGIPSSLCTSNLKLYNRLWYRCKQHGLTYEEALRYETEPLPKPVTKPEVALVQVSPVQGMSALIKPIPSAPLPQFGPGVLVKQVRPDHGRKLQSVGTVVSLERGGQLVNVRDSEGKIHKIDIRCLEVYVQKSGRDEG
jgi:hypothetical protein